MTFSPRAIEAALDAFNGCKSSNDIDAMQAALTAALAVDGLALQGWQPIESAPKDGSTILVVGQPTQIDGVNIGSGVFTAYWDDIDSSFCLSAATWLGPFIKPSCWQPLPPPPAASDGEERSSPPQQWKL